MADTLAEEFQSLVRGVAAFGAAVERLKEMMGHAGDDFTVGPLLAQLADVRSLGERAALNCMRSVWVLSMKMAEEDLAEAGQDPARRNELAGLKVMSDRFVAVGGSTLNPKT